jgi:hypothetical protein
VATAFGTFAAAILFSRLINAYPAASGVTNNSPLAALPMIEIKKSFRGAGTTIG